jgi:16S rRNA (guanine966-N2)-methyltransferase
MDSIVRILAGERLIKMRVISGLLKGKSIKFQKNQSTRPLKDAVKENIFNILKHSNLINIKIDDSNILDLYSGFGSFGIECISRGAKQVTFIEQDRSAAKILKNNLTQLSITKKTKILNNKIETILKNNSKEKFNIFFFDPPFKDKDFIKNLHFIKKNKMYKTKHIIIIHREKNSKDDINNLINIIDSKQYGRSKIIFGLFN